MNADGGTASIEANLIQAGPVLWHKTTWNNSGHGGNIEVFPPHVTRGGRHFRSGRAVLGSRRADVADLINRQGIQHPVVIDLPWLALGHIDEVFCFLSDAQALVTDPVLAWQEVIEMVNNPIAEKTIRVGDAAYDLAEQTVTDPENFFFKKTETLEHFLDVSDTLIRVTRGQYQVGDYLLVDREVIKVIGKTQATGGETHLSVERGQAYGNSGQSHAVGALLRILSDESVVNVYGRGQLSEALSIRIEQMLAQLETKLDTTVTRTGVPVLFGWSPNGAGQGQYVAATVNMVNCVVRPAEPPATLVGTIYASNPGNARFCQLFSSMVSVNVSFTQGEDDRRAWEYHLLEGELHCGSNSKRSFPDEPWWTHDENQNWLAP